MHKTFFCFAVLLFLCHPSQSFSVSHRYSGMPLKRNCGSVTGGDDPRTTFDYLSLSAPDKQCSTSKRRRLERAAALNQAAVSDGGSGMLLGTFERQCASKNHRFFESGQSSRSHLTVVSLDHVVATESSRCGQTVPSLDCAMTTKESSDDEEVYEVILGHDGTIHGQASYQRTHAGIIVDYNGSGDNAYTCEHCAALFWLDEALKKKKKITD